MGLEWGIAVCLRAVSLHMASVAGSWRAVGQFVPGTAQIREPLVTCFTLFLLIDPERCDRYVVPKRRQQTAIRRLKASHIPCILIPKMQLSLVVFQCSGFRTRSLNWRIISISYWSAVAFCPAHVSTLKCSPGNVWFVAKNCTCEYFSASSCFSPCELFSLHALVIIIIIIIIIISSLIEVCYVK